MMPKNTVRLSLFLCGVALALSSCGDTKQKLGLVRQAPDEFAVVKRAPLEMPPDYTLLPPQPGAARPQEQAPMEQARKVVFGTPQVTETKAGTAEALLLQQTGAVNADPSIRRVIDQETARLEPADKPVAEKLLGWAGGDDAAPASVVDAKAEAARLQRNQAEGKPVTEGETPTIEE